jgi:hypothetical protein
MFKGRQIAASQQLFHIVHSTCSAAANSGVLTDPVTSTEGARAMHQGHNLH